MTDRKYKIRLTRQSLNIDFYLLSVLSSSKFEKSQCDRNAVFEDDRGLAILQPACLLLTAARVQTTKVRSYPYNAPKRDASSIDAKLSLLERN